MPRWMSTIDDFGAGKSGGLAFLLSAINPKNLALTIAAVSTIAGAGISTGEEIGVLAIYIAIASVTILLPVAMYLIMGQRAQESLESMKEWLIANNHTVVAIILLLLGAKLIGDGIGILSG